MFQRYFVVQEFSDWIYEGWFGVQDYCIGFGFGMGIMVEFWGLFQKLGLKSNFRILVFIREVWELILLVLDSGFEFFRIEEQGVVKVENKIFKVVQLQG